MGGKFLLIVTFSDMSNGIRERVQLYFIQMHLYFYKFSHFSGWKRETKNFVYSFFYRFSYPS